MKLNRILPVAGVLILLAGAALAQALNVPAGATAGTYRPAPGARVGGSFNPRLAAAHTNKQAVSKSCSQQADAQGLHGRARRAFRGKCRRSGGR